MRYFWIDRIHAGFARVTLKFLRDGDRVWVESDGKVGASLDVNTGEFRSELDPKPAWAKYGQGQKLDEGVTSSVLWLLGPW